MLQWEFEWERVDLCQFKHMYVAPLEANTSNERKSSTPVDSEESSSGIGTQGWSPIGKAAGGGGEGLNVFM